MNEELKSCPFCGEDKIEVSHHYSGVTELMMYSCQCSTCGANGGQGPCPFDARSLWQMRADDDSTR